MSNHRVLGVAMVSAFAAMALLAQEAPAFDPEACAKHCREMAAARAKDAEAWKTRMQQREAAWKEIETQLQLARSSRGDKKLAALEAAVSKLVEYEGSAGTPACPMMGHGPMAAGKGCCGAMAAGPGGAHPGCCGAGHHAGHGSCPMARTPQTGTD